MAFKSVITHFLAERQSVVILGGTAVLNNFPIPWDG